MRHNSTITGARAVVQQPLGSGQGKSGNTLRDSTRPNPVGSTSDFSKHQSEQHFAIKEHGSKSLSDFLTENYPMSAERHPATLDFRGVFVPGFDGFSYGLRTAMLNDTVRVSLNHPIQHTPVFSPKTGGKNGRPPMGIAKPSIFDSKKTGISESPSSAEGPL